MANNPAVTNSTVQGSRPELKQPAPAKASPFEVFANTMEKVLVDKAVETEKSGEKSLMSFIQGAKNQLHKIEEAVKRNEPSAIKKHSVHLANYAFLITTKVD